VRSSTPCRGPTRESRPGAERVGAILAAAAASIALLPVVALGQLPTPPGAPALTLEQGLAIAQERSPALALERARLEEASADDAIALAGLLPRVSVSAYGQRLNADRLGPLGTSAHVPGATLYTEEAFAGARAKQVLFDGSRAWHAHAATERGLDAARLGVELTSADVVLGVTQAFVRLAVAQEIARVAGDAVERQRAFEDLARALAEAGRGSKVDPLRARAQRLDAERALVAAHEAEAAAAAQLRRSMGDDPGDPVRAAGALPEPMAAPDDERALVASALAGSKDLVRVERQTAQASASAIAAAATWFPEISVQGTYGWRGRDVGGRAPEWSAGAFLEWPIFEGGAGHGAADKARARVAQAEAARSALELQIEADVREALAGWRSAFAAAASTAESVVVSGEALAAAEALYRAGRATALDVLTAQVELARSEASRTQALGDVVVARARVERLVGGLRGRRG